MFCYAFFSFGDVIIIILLKTKISSVLKLSKYSLDHQIFHDNQRCPSTLQLFYLGRWVLLLFEIVSQTFNSWGMFISFCKTKWINKCIVFFSSNVNMFSVEIYRIKQEACTVMTSIRSYTIRSNTEWEKVIFVTWQKKEQWYYLWKHC